MNYIKEELKELKELINTELKKWYEYSKKCQTYKYLYKVNDIVDKYFKAEIEEQFHFIHKKVGLSYEMIMKCFNKIGTSEEKQSDLNKKEFEAFKIWFKICKYLLIYHRTIFSDYQSWLDKDSAIYKSIEIEKLGLMNLYLDIKVEGRLKRRRDSHLKEILYPLVKKLVEKKDEIICCTK